MLNPVAGGKCYSADTMKLISDANLLVQFSLLTVSIQPKKYVYSDGSMDAGESDLV